jgi:hypothetical protein
LAPGMALVIQERRPMAIDGDGSAGEGGDMLARVRGKDDADAKAAAIQESNCARAVTEQLAITS